MQSAGCHNLFPHICCRVCSDEVVLCSAAKRTSIAAADEVDDYTDDSSSSSSSDEDVSAVEQEPIDLEKQLQR